MLSQPLDGEKSHLCVRTDRRESNGSPHNTFLCLSLLALVGVSLALMDGRLKVQMAHITSRSLTDSSHHSLQHPAPPLPPPPPVCHPGS